MVPKAKGEILGVVIVESGWGSMLPTIVLANLLPTGPAARCGQLNIGDQVKKKIHTFCILHCYFTDFFFILQVIAINGISLVGLPLSTCQTYIKVRLSQYFNSIPAESIVNLIFLNKKSKKWIFFSRLMN